MVFAACALLGHSLILRLIPAQDVAPTKCKWAASVSASPDSDSDTMVSVSSAKILLKGIAQHALSEKFGGAH